MKKIICILSSILAFSCAKSSNAPVADVGNSDTTIVKPSPISDPVVKPVPQPEPPTPPKPEEKIVKINFGSDGAVSLDKETGEYNIEKIPTNAADFDFEQPSKGMFDSIIPDPIYSYRSSLFPVDRYSLFQIPDILNFDTINSVDSQPSNNKNDSFLQFWGKLGNKKEMAYFACYKSIKNMYSKLDFIVEERDDLYSNPSCEKYKKLIEEKKVTPLNLNGGDFIMLRFYGFRFETSGDCFDNSTCKISYNSKIKYFTQIK